MTASQVELDAIVKKVAWRLLPLISICYVVAYLDRSNIGVASLTMMPTLGLDAAQFGFAAGVFFLGYCSAEIPSNLLQVRFGARRWLARIMIVWGIIAAAMAFVVGPKSLYAVRIALGLAEAGFVPGAVMYLAFWIPEHYRARAFAIFSIATPVSVVIGAPLSASLLYTEHIGHLHGWQWLFIIEGIPAVALGLICLKALPDTPEDATWLVDKEKSILVDALKSERSPPESAKAPIRGAILNAKMWLMAVVGIGLGASSFGVVVFSPQIIADFIDRPFEVGLISALPFLIAVVVTILWSKHSDRTNERRWHLVLPLLLAAAGFIIMALSETLALKVTGLIAVAAGAYMPTPVFWQYIPVIFKQGANAAAGTAMVTSIANLGGFFQPTIMGYLKVLTGSYRSGLLVASAIVACSALAALRFTAPARIR